jgi:hypothetical protein
MSGVWIAGLLVLPVSVLVMLVMLEGYRDGNRGRVHPAKPSFSFEEQW